jgi:hypothetical protein
MTLIDVLSRVGLLFHDVAFERLPGGKTDYTAFVNDAIRQVVLVRPDANVVTSVVQLVPGTKQTLPASGVRLIDITRNMGADGTSPGAPITEVERSILDAMNYSWHSDVGETSIENYAFDVKNPRVFHVTPPVHSATAVNVEMSYSSIPTALVDDADDFPLDDIFFGPVVDFTLYRMNILDDASQASDFKAQHYLSNFYNALGLEFQGGQAVAPGEEKRRAG